METDNPAQAKGAVLPRLDLRFAGINRVNLIAAARLRDVAAYPLFVWWALHRLPVDLSFQDS